jgi:sugar O-acyltransferase (sialic acid O-acetyltransferase NeuD family)
MSKPLLLFPFGGNAQEALLAIQAINAQAPQWDVLGFVDDDPATHGKERLGVQVLGGRDILARYPQAQVLAVNGNPEQFRNRKAVIDSLNIPSERFATVIHPAVSIASDTLIGYNTLIMPQVFISCGVAVGNHCVILPQITIAHDACIGDYCCIGAHVTISGHVAIEDGCYIGAGASLKDHICIKSRSLVGLGAVVIQDVAADQVVAGNPAKTIHAKTK